MSFLFSFTRPLIVIAIAAVGFGGVQGYMAAKAEPTPATVSKSDPIAAKLAHAKADPIAAKLAERKDFTGVMSPIYPTTKYTAAQLAIPSGTKKPAKVAVRRANKMPMQIAYIPDRPIVR
jgi:hypothetical protein